MAAVKFSPNIVGIIARKAILLEMKSPVSQALFVRILYLCQKMDRTSSKVNTNGTSFSQAEIRSLAPLICSKNPSFPLRPEKGDYHTTMAYDLRQTNISRSMVRIL